MATVRVRKIAKAILWDGGNADPIFKFLLGCGSIRRDPEDWSTLLLLFPLCSEIKLVAGDWIVSFGGEGCRVLNPVQFDAQYEIIGE